MFSIKYNPKVEKFNHSKQKILDFSAKYRYIEYLMPNIEEVF